MSEVGWAYYLDKEAGSSYNMNERFSKAGDGYVTPSILSNPIDSARARPCTVGTPPSRARVCHRARPHLLAAAFAALAATLGVETLAPEGTPGRLAPGLRAPAGWC